MRLWRMLYWMETDNAFVSTACGLPELSVQNSIVVISAVDTLFEICNRFCLCLLGIHLLFL